MTDRISTADLEDTMEHETKQVNDALDRLKKAQRRQAELDLGLVNAKASLDVHAAKLLAAVRAVLDRYDEERDKAELELGFEIFEEQEGEYYE